MVTWVRGRVTGGHWGWGRGDYQVTIRLRTAESGSWNPIGWKHSVHVSCHGTPSVGNILSYMRK